MDDTVTDTVTLGLAQAYDLAHGVLVANGFSTPHAGAIARALCRAQQDECHSHGLFRLLMCMRAARDGHMSRDAEPRVSQPRPAMVRVDAGYACSLHAFDVARPILVRTAREHGIAALAINNCHHFSAVWPEVEDLAADGVAALCMLPSYSFVAPAGGTRPILGTNPFAFGWPRPNRARCVFDFATSTVARGEIDLHRRTGTPIPPGWALDATGAPTTDAAAALAGSMLPFGGHKGSALATMVELLAGALIGDLTSLEATAAGSGGDAAPRHGELVIAFDMAAFGRQAAEERAEALFAAFSQQGARLPSERRYAARARSIARDAVSIPRSLLDDIRALHP